MNTGTDTHSRIQIEQWKDERAAQQAQEDEEQAAWLRQHAIDEAAKKAARAARVGTRRPVTRREVLTVAALLAGAYLGWVALPHVAGWLLELPIWYR